MIMSRLNKEFEKLDFEKSELAYQEFERCKRNLGHPMTSYLRDMDRTYTKMIERKNKIVRGDTRPKASTSFKSQPRRTASRHRELWI